MHLLCGERLPFCSVFMDILHAPSWIAARYGSLDSQADTPHRPLKSIYHIMVRLDLSGDDAALLQRTRQSVRSYLRKADELGFDFEIAGDQHALVTMHDWYQRGSLEWQQAASTLLPVGFFRAGLFNPVQVPAITYTSADPGPTVGKFRFALRYDF